MLNTSIGKNTRVVVAFLIMLFLLSGASAAVFASNGINAEELGSNPSVSSLYCQAEAARGTVASTLQSLFDDENSVKTVELSSATLSIEDGKLVFCGSLDYGDEQIALRSMGDFYTNTQTEHSGPLFHDNLIFGEMGDCGNIHFVQLRIDRDESSLLLVLQEIDTEFLLRFQLPLGDDLFDRLDNQTTHQLRGTDFEEKILSLYSIQRNIIGYKQVSDEVDSSFL